MCTKYSEFRKWLRDQGVEIKAGKGSHFRLTLNGKISIFPDHGSKEIGTGLMAQIKKQLGLK
ncbi:putative mRNA interferase HicA [Caballeronia novacaledonica]|uniref:Putative mRNA interferase HicA n=1 Tax=Caballeronia novacaledonica TaxID=1544861 RepID=A0A2U3IF22_9BURK|nr:type II toxin-antitoxin system HicA family toxin [Caballeronia novacaledonica]SPB18723.1 putative mRNA interferase HicA [Caballeronia novacaledonica]